MQNELRLKVSKMKNELRLRLMNQVHGVLSADGAKEDVYLTADDVREVVGAIVSVAIQFACFFNADSTQRRKPPDQRALREGTDIVREIVNAFEKCVVLVDPTTGEDIRLGSAFDHLGELRNDHQT
jgi:hypothetical protein